MGIGDIKAAVTVVLSIRDDWAEQRRAVAGQVEELAGVYDHPDVLYAAVVIARDLDNRAPVMLTVKAAQVVGELHARKASNPTSTGSRGRIKNQYACDTCNLTRDLCEQQAGNLNGADHLFKTIADAEAERQRQRHVREFPPGGRELSDFSFGKLPADVDALSHPEPEQRDGAA